MSIASLDHSKIPDGAFIMPAQYLDGTIIQQVHMPDGSILPLEEFIRPSKKLTALIPLPTAEPQKKQTATQTGYLARFPDLVDVVEDHGCLVYLVAQGTQLKTMPSVTLDGKQAFPPPREQLPFLIPRWEQINHAYHEDTPQALFSDLIDYHKTYSQLPSEAYYILLATWDFSTYILEALNYSGYIYLYAVPERGKTKTGQAMIYVAYRGIHQENLREANLFRASHDLGATLFIDVSNLSRKAIKENSQDIVLQRFEKGAKVQRVLHPEWGPFRDSRFYDVFGATVIATNEPINEVMESRSFPIDMPYAHSNFLKPLPQQGLPYRERLLAWRAHFLIDRPTLPLPPQFPTGRISDIAAPLWQIINLVSPSYCPHFEELVRELNEKRRQGKASTLEGEVIKALLDLQSAVEDGKIEVDRITDKVNEGRKDFHKESSRYIGKVLRRLGFQLSRRHASKRRYYYDVELLNHLTAEYGLSDTPPDFASQPSQSSPHIAESQLCGDNGDKRDAFSDDVHIPVEATTEELLATQGWCLWQCSTLDDEIIALVRDESIKGVPEGYVVYTKAEMEEFGRLNVPHSTIRLVHESKKRTSATVTSVESNHKENQHETLESRP
ncbi:MAG: hypothetical protein NTW48_04410 [Chloroflexi bacterium]|nr:hypothetical protein [Chloroflexota bacterium]